MGRIWPADAVSRNQATTALSNVVSLDESQLREGLIYAGTDDGLIQITEDGGKSWRRVEEFPGVPQWTYVSDVLASPRDADTYLTLLEAYETYWKKAFRQHRFSAPPEWGTPDPLEEPPAACPERHGFCTSP